MNRPYSLFVSHGAPTFALEPGLAGPQLTQLGQTLARPKAVLVVSPHWMTRDLSVATTARPKTIHDFGGFPSELYQIEYPAPGHPELAKATADLLRTAGLRVNLDEQHGLDHGAWVPLLYLYPAADVPVFQVSLPARLDAAGTWELGAALAPLSEQGVLIVGSGSLTHNLYEFRQSQDREETYAIEFVEWVREAVVTRDRARLVHALELRRTPRVRIRPRNTSCPCWLPPARRPQMRRYECCRVELRTAYFRWNRMYSALRLPRI